MLLADPTPDLSCTVNNSTGFFTAVVMLPWLPLDLPEAVPLLHAHQTNHHTSQQTDHVLLHSPFPSVCGGLVASPGDQLSILGLTEKQHISR